MYGSTGRDVISASGLWLVALCPFFQHFRRVLESYDKQTPLNRSTSTADTSSLFFNMAVVVVASNSITSAKPRCPRTHTFHTTTGMYPNGSARPPHGSVHISVPSPIHPLTLYQSSKKVLIISFLTSYDGLPGLLTPPDHPSVCCKALKFLRAPTLSCVDYWQKLRGRLQDHSPASLFSLY